MQIKLIKSGNIKDDKIKDFTLNSGFFIARKTELTMARQKWQYYFFRFWHAIIDLQYDIIIKMLMSENLFCHNKYLVQV